MLTIPVVGQVQDSTVTDSAATEIIPADSLASTGRDTVLQNREKEPEPVFVVPWNEKNSFGSHIITNDSLMRWQIWPNWGDFQAYRRDVISFRQGTNGRIDAYHINGYEPYEQQLEMEGLSLNNPITGLPDYNLVPHRKMGVMSEAYGGNYYSDIRLRDYYIIKPISYLNYDEAEGEYRNLEFLVSQNFTARTNVEASYWDRRGGAYYPNSDIKGSQVVARVYHHLSERFLVRGLYLRNQLSNDEPFGYNIGDPSFFLFDQFGSPPVNASASSEFTRWDLAGGIYHRQDTSSAEDGGLEVSMTKSKKDLRFSPDTLSWDIRTLSGNLFKSLNWKRFEVRGEIGGKHNSAEEFSTISQENWTNIQAKTSARLAISKSIEVYGRGEWNNRSDNKNGFDLSSGLIARFPGRLHFSASFSGFSRAPAMQALYLNKGNYRGNSSLENETGISAAGNLDFYLTKTLTFGASGRFKSSESATFLTPDSTFTNSPNVHQLFGMAYGRFENHLFEIESSGTLQQYEYAGLNAPEAELNHQDQIIWIRNSAFVKGYIFDRAAYLKIGAKTLLSPFFYASRTYNTELGIWQGNSAHLEIPPFFRLDGELSARVRGIMVVIRWENALDGLGQTGYFEAAGFPMPPRRLIVGIRAQFRN